MLHSSIQELNSYISVIVYPSFLRLNPKTSRAKRLPLGTTLNKAAFCLKGGTYQNLGKPNSLSLTLAHLQVLARPVLATQLQARPPSSNSVAAKELALRFSKSWLSCLGEQGSNPRSQGCSILCKATAQLYCATRPKKVQYAAQQHLGAEQLYIRDTLF